MAKPFATPPRAAEASRRRRGRNRITFEGIAFVSLAILIGLAAVNTGTNLLYLVLAMMLAMLLISGVQSHVNLRRLSLMRHYPAAVHAGQTADGMLRVGNDKRLASSYALGLEDEVFGPLDSWVPPRRLALNGFVAELGARRRDWCPLPILLPTRGLYRLERTRVRSRFPFGFFEHTRSFDEAPATLLVYPALLPYSAFMRLAPRLLGELENDRRGQGTGIFGVRNYETGDPVRFIHWKQSARGQGLKTKEFEEEVSRRFMLMLDLRCPAEPAESLLLDFEKAVSLTASLARHLLRETTAVGLWTSAGTIPEGQGAAHLRRLLRTLARVQPQPQGGAAGPWPRGPGSTRKLWVEYYARPALPPFVERASPDTHILDARQVDLEFGKGGLIP